MSGFTTAPSALLPLTLTGGRQLGWGAEQGSGPRGPGRPLAVAPRGLSRGSRALAGAHAPPSLLAMRVRATAGGGAGGGAAEGPRPEPGAAFQGLVEEAFPHGFMVRISLGGHEYRGLLYSPELGRQGGGAAGGMGARAGCAIGGAPGVVQRARKVGVVPGLTGRSGRAPGGLEGAGAHGLGRGRGVQDPAPALAAGPGVTAGRAVRPGAQPSANGPARGGAAPVKAVEAPAVQPGPSLGSGGGPGDGAPAIQGPGEAGGSCVREALGEPPPAMGRPTGAAPGPDAEGSSGGGRAEAGAGGVERVAGGREAGSAGAHQGAAGAPVAGWADAAVGHAADVAPDAAAHGTVLAGAESVAYTPLVVEVEGRGRSEADAAPDSLGSAAAASQVARAAVQGGPGDAAPSVTRGAAALRHTSEDGAPAVRGTQAPAEVMMTDLPAADTTAAVKLTLDAQAPQAAVTAPPSEPTPAAAPPLVATAAVTCSPQPQQPPGPPAAGAKHPRSSDGEAATAGPPRPPAGPPSLSGAAMRLSGDGGSAGGSGRAGSVAALMPRPPLTRFGSGRARRRGHGPHFYFRQERAPQLRASQPGLTEQALAQLVRRCEGPPPDSAWQGAQCDELRPPACVRRRPPAHGALERELPAIICAPCRDIELWPCSSRHRLPRSGMGWAPSSGGPL